MKKRFIFTLLIFCSLLMATLSPTVALAQQDEQPRTAQLGENRGQVPEGGSEIWTETNALRNTAIAHRYPQGTFCLVGLIALEDYSMV